MLLKLGTYGFLRLCLPMFPDACQTVGVPLMAALAVVGIIYGSLCALAQRDIKKLVAYSSVATWASACWACSRSTRRASPAACCR